MGVALVGSLILWPHPMVRDYSFSAAFDWTPTVVAALWLGVWFLPRTVRVWMPVLVVALAVFSVLRNHRDTLHLEPLAEQEALEEAEKRPMPGFYKWHTIMAAANARLGREQAAGEHVQKILDLVPDFGQRARTDLSNEFVSQEFIEHYLEGLAKAGLSAD